MWKGNFFFVIKDKIWDGVNNMAMYAATQIRTQKKSRTGKFYAGD